MADLWRQIQSTPGYKDRTTLIISTDHGRGSGPVEWKDHGVEQKGSENIWIAVIGPDTAPLGERHDVPAVTQSQIAATIAALVGEDFRAFNPAAAPSLLEALSKH
jgi:DNA mismatch repair protein MutH